MDIKQIQSLRRVYLLKLYETTGGDRWQNPIMFEIGKSIGIEDTLTEIIVDYLVQKGFIEYLTKERDISITASGVDEAEKYFEDQNIPLSRDDIYKILEEMNYKLDLLALGQEISYEDIMAKLGASQSIQSKDLKLILISTIFSKGLDAIKITQILDILK